MTVEPAEIGDMPGVDALRAIHFANSGLAVQERSQQAVWWVARDGLAGVAGCACLEDVPALRQRWLLDCYAVPGRVGKRALIAMYARIRADAQRDRVAIVGMCQPNNQKQINAYMRRGGVIVGVLLSLAPEEVPCPV
jgi:hypothetical protein